MNKTGKTKDNQRIKEECVRIKKMLRDAFKEAEGQLDKDDDKASKVFSRRFQAC